MEAERDRLRTLALQAPPMNQRTITDSNGSADEQETANEDKVETRQYSVTALEQFELYVNFVRRRIIPGISRLQSNPLPNKVRFNDLWYLFQPGQIVYAPPPSDHSSSIAQTLWRICEIKTPGDLIPFTRDQSPYQLSPRSLELAPSFTFNLTCYYVDFDGKKYGPLIKKFDISSYKDEQDITSLPIYPLQYLDDHEKYIHQACDDGRRLIDLISSKYGSYGGWTLTKTPAGEDFQDSHNRMEEVVLPEHIDSDILVDFQEAFNQFPSWKPILAAGGEREVLSNLEWEELDYNVWEDQKRSKTISIISEKLVVGDGLSDILYNDFVRIDEFLKGGRKKLSEEESKHLALLPKRLVAYALWERKFVQVDLRHVKQM